MANALAVFYNESAGGVSCAKAAWERVHLLLTHKQVIRIVVLHQQSPEPALPNQVELVGNDMWYANGAVDGLLVGRRDTSPGNGLQKEAAFDLAGGQDLSRDVDSKLWDLRLNGAGVRFLAMPENAPGYASKLATAQAMDPNACPPV
jgi:hypothetical protein